jgi:hypothetical protein
MTTNRIKAVVMLSGTLLGSAAGADVVMEQKMNMEAAGALAMMGTSGTIKTMVSGDRGRTENKMEASSGLMRTLAKNANTATIVRLDQEKMINLMPEEKKYSEVSFEQLRQQYQEAMKQLEEVQQSGGLPVSEDECQWSEPVMSVNQTGESERFAGVKASQTLITASQSCTVPDANKSCDMTWTLDYWMAKRMPGDDEILDFQKGMAAAMGGDEQLAMVQAQVRGMMAMFKKGWDEVLSESGDLEGYPVKTVMSMEIGGENCTTGTGQPIAMDEIWGQAANAGLNAATAAAAGEASAAVGGAIAESMGDSVGGSIAGSAVGAASREVIGGLFNKFGKKKKEKEQAQQAEQAAPTTADSVVLIRMTTELTRIEKENVPDSAFEVPAGWKQVDPAGF